MSMFTSRDSVSIWKRPPLSQRRTRCGRQAVIERYHGEEGYQVEESWEALERSRRGYNAARKRPPAETIVSKIKEIHGNRHFKGYGSPGMTSGIQQEHGFSCSENRVARFMASNGVQARHKAIFRTKTTTQDVLTQLTRSGESP